MQIRGLGELAASEPRRVTRIIDWDRDAAGETVSIFAVDRPFVFNAPSVIGLDTEAGFVAAAESSDYMIEVTVEGVLAGNSRDGIVSFDKVTPLPGEWAAVNGVWAGEFWHWICESVPRIVALLDSGFTGRFILPPLAPYVRDTLRILGIPEERTISPRAGIFLVEKLYCTSRMNGYRMGARTFERTRSRMAPQLAAGPASGRGTRLYIPRRVGGVVLNEEDLLRAITPFGFRTVYMEDLPLDEQIALASGADAILGPHGGGTALAMFMPPRRLVIEIFSPEYINPVLTTTCRHLQSRYHMVPSHVIGRWDSGRDATAEISDIVQILESWDSGA